MNACMSFVMMGRSGDSSSCTLMGTANQILCLLASALETANLVILKLVCL